MRSRTGSTNVYRTLRPFFRRPTAIINPGYTGGPEQREQPPVHTTVTSISSNGPPLLFGEALIPEDPSDPTKVVIDCESFEYHVVRNYLHNLIRVCNAYFLALCAVRYA